jgi:hypothetical protein
MEIFLVHTQWLKAQGIRSKAKKEKKKCPDLSPKNAGIEKMRSPMNHFERLKVVQILNAS